MCGIFGIISRPAGLGCQHLRPLVETLFLLSETRGKESAGIAVIDRDTIRLQKSPVRPRQFLRTPAFNTFFEAAATNIYGTGHAFAVIGHSRLVTNGSQDHHANNQPVNSGGIVAVHNGIIVNDEALWKTSNRLLRRAEVDTEVLAQLLRQGLGDGKPLGKVLRETWAAIKGTVSTALIFNDINGLLLATNHGSLYTATNPRTGTTLFASEAFILKSLIEKHNDRLDIGVASISQLTADHAMFVNFATLMPHTFDIIAEAGANLPIEVLKRTILDETPVAEVVDGAGAQSYAFVPRRFSPFEIDPEPIKRLKRCTRCILPETVPYIDFDGAGVCNFCREHKPRSYTGVEALRAKAEKLRQPGGRPECLFTLSGGRDSSFGLHYAVKELNLKPVAFTYDWGMITDLARRNQARMCGALKIEHILVSADIAEKRRNIRRNVIAWLKKPTLGMIPLFMAGDKQYFYFANNLAKQLDLTTTILASNPLEKTHFKAGFCDVPPTKGHRPSKLSQLRMASYFAARFLENPRYLNPSLLDTAGAFVSYYFIHHNYLRLFDYVPWVEREVNDTLIGMYDWETAKDTGSTWRIGDGTAAFYNYIYYRVAGFSENDTFRSNQVREKMLDRGTALRLSKAENAPRFESIDWYCRVIGLDTLEVLETISKISPIYRI